MFPGMRLTLGTRKEGGFSGIFPELAFANSGPLRERMDASLFQNLPPPVFRGLAPVSRDPQIHSGHLDFDVAPLIYRRFAIPVQYTGDLRVDGFRMLALPSSHSRVGPRERPGISRIDHSYTKDE